MPTHARFSTFLLLTFLVSWGIPGAVLLAATVWNQVPFSLAMYSPLYYVGVWGPAIAALILVGREAGAAGVGRYLGRLLDWRIGWRWWLFTLAGIPALYFLGALAEYGIGRSDAVGWYRGSWLALAGAFLLRATAGPVEELGWRGFALPLLQRRMTPVRALLVLAAVHTLWHAPVFLVGQFAHFGTALPFPVALLRFLLNIAGITVFLNVAYNANGGSLTIAFLIHWMLNGIYPWEGEADTFSGQVVVTGAAAVVMLMMVGRTWLRPERAAVSVIPGDGVAGDRYQKTKA